MAFQIAQAEENDLEEIAVLFDAYRRFYGKAADIDGARQFLRERLRNAESVIFLGRNDERAVGFTQLYPLFTSVGMQHTWLLNDLFVDASARRGGMATALLQAAREHALSTAAAGVLLETQIVNRDAQQLYEKFGFRRNDETWFYYLAV